MENLSVLKANPWGIKEPGLDRIGGSVLRSRNELLIVGGVQAQRWGKMGETVTAKNNDIVQRRTGEGGKRFLHTLTCTNGSAWIVGGIGDGGQAPTESNYTGFGYLKQVVRIPLGPEGKDSNETILNHQSPMVAGHTAVPHLNTVLLFGGWTLPSTDDGSEILSNSVRYIGEQKDLESTNAPTCRAFHVAILYDGKMFIHGGVTTDQRILSDVWSFDLKTQTWEEVLGATGGVPALMCHSAVEYNGALIVSGGLNEKTSGALSIYNIVAKSWRSIATGTTMQRALHCAVLLKERKNKTPDDNHNNNNNNNYVKILKNLDIDAKSTVAVQLLIFGGVGVSSNPFPLVQSLASPPMSKTLQICREIPPKSMILSLGTRQKRRACRRLFDAQVESQREGYLKDRLKKPHKNVHPALAHLEPIVRSIWDTTEHPATYGELSDGLSSWTAANETTPNNTIELLHAVREQIWNTKRSETPADWKTVRNGVNELLLEMGTVRLHYAQVKSHSEKMKKNLARHATREGSSKKLKDIDSMVHRLHYKAVKTKSAAVKKVEQQMYPKTTPVTIPDSTFTKKFYYGPVAEQKKYRDLLEISYMSPCPDGDRKILNLCDSSLMMTGAGEQQFSSSEGRISYAERNFPVVPCGEELLQTSPMYRSLSYQKESVDRMHRGKAREKGDLELYTLGKWCNDKLRQVNRLKQTLTKKEFVAILEFQIHNDDKKELTEMMVKLSKHHEKLEVLAPLVEIHWMVDEKRFFHAHPNHTDVKTLKYRTDLALKGSSDHLPDQEPAPLPSPILAFAKPDIATSPSSADQPTEQNLLDTIARRNRMRLRRAMP